MARTYRKKVKRLDNTFRRTQHVREKAQLRQLLVDNWVEEFNIAGINRINKRLVNLPYACDDSRVSSMWDKYANGKNT